MEKNLMKVDWAVVVVTAVVVILGAAYVRNEWKTARIDSRIEAVRVVDQQREDTLLYQAWRNGYLLSALHCDRGIDLVLRDMSADSAKFVRLINIHP